MDTYKIHIYNSRPRRFNPSLPICSPHMQGWFEEMFSSRKSVRHLVSRNIWINMMWSIWIFNGVWNSRRSGECSFLHLTNDSGIKIITWNSADSLLLLKALSCVLPLVKSSLIIDEWDVLIRDASTDLVVQGIHQLSPQYVQVLNLPNIQLAYLTGILPIKKSKHSQLWTILRSLQWLTPGSFPDILALRRESTNALRKIPPGFLKTKHWYDGYLLGNMVYNPKNICRINDLE